MLDTAYLDCQVAYLDKYKNFYLVLEGSIKVVDRFNDSTDYKTKFYSTKDVISGENANIQNDSKMSTFKKTKKKPLQGTNTVLSPKRGGKIILSPDVLGIMDHPKSV